MMTRPELEAFKRPAQDMNPRGFGYTEFALIKEIFTQGYVDNNQLLIKVQAQPV
jgi:TNF receptor-associated factor 6